MKTKSDKLNEVYEYVRSQGVIHTKKDFAQLIGVNHTNLSSAFKGNEKYLTDNLFSSICSKFKQLELDYFIGDKQNMIRDDCDSDVDNDIGSHTVVMLPISAQAGTLNDFIVSIKEVDTEKIVSPIRGADFAITVTGDSMAPEYPNGSRILIKKIDEKSFIEWGKVYVLDTNNGVVVKILNEPDDKPTHLLCTSINPDQKRYAPFLVPKSDVLGVYKVMLCMSLK